MVVPDTYTLARVSAACYETDQHASRPWLEEQGWRMVGSMRKSYMVMKDSAIIIAHRGTVVTDVEDLLCDTAMVVGLEASMPRFKQAVRHARTVKRRFPSHKLYISGHSLGASVCIWTTYENHDVERGVAFNAYITPAMKNPLVTPTFSFWWFNKTYNDLELRIVNGDLLAGETIFGFDWRGWTVVRQDRNPDYGGAHGLTQFLSITVPP